MSKIVVIGSSNVDFTAKVKSMPKPGETICGNTLICANGGKGANQAVTAGRLGADVAFLTCVGNDSQGHNLKEQFEKDGMDTSAMNFSASKLTGMAMICVDENAENSIVVVPGANSDLKPEDIEKAEPLLSNADYFLLQLEIPMETVEKSVTFAKDKGIKVVLNPAPMKNLSPEVLEGLYLITPNELEAENLTGVKIETTEDALKASDLLKAKGVQNVIITLGSAGSLVCTQTESSFVPALKVDAVDTTAAGDVYNGALVTSLSEGKSLFEAAEFATKVAAVSVTRLGAQSSIPFRNELETK